LLSVLILSVELAFFSSLSLVFHSEDSPERDG